MVLANPGSAVLYRDATGLERAMADADAERLVGTEAERIYWVWDPYKIPLQYLPYLAWAMGVNYWDDNWHETTKRAWVARQWEFKAIRGTLAGSRMAIDYSGRDVSPFGYELLSAIVPPQKVFSGPSLTKAEREAWLATMPQLRVWRVQEKGIAGAHKSFYGGESNVRMRSRRFFLEGEAPTPTTALQRLHRRARWIVDNVETDVSVTELGSAWQVHLPGKAGYRVMSNMPFRPGRYFIPSDAWTRLFTIAPKQALPWRTSIKQSLEPVSAEPERVVINGTRGFSVFCNVPMSPRAYFIPSTAWKRIFQRYAIPMNNTGHLKRRSPVQFMGTGRYGFPKYTAWLRVRLTSRRSRYAAGEGIAQRKLKFWLPHDGRTMIRARAAVVASKRLVDRIWLDTGPVYRFVAGRPFIAGVDQLIVGRP